MKKTFLIFGISFLLMAFFNSCQKYDEGPWISFRSKEKRLLGSWQIEHYYLNGHDSSSYFTQYDSPLVQFDANRIYFTIQDFYTLNPKTSKWIDAEWNWANNDEYILMDFVEPGHLENEWLNTGPFIIGETVSWEIKKLKLKELILETTYSNVLYRMEFGRLDL